MGELGAFLKITRVPAAGARSARARRRLRRDLRGPARGRGRAPGRPLHGVRRPVLPRRLPARQPDPGLERPRLPGPLARGDRPAARDEQLPRVHRADLPGAVRAGLRARDQRRPGLDQADRAGDRRARLGGGLDRRRARPSTAPAAASPSSAPAPPASPPPQQLNRAGHEVVVYERDEGPGGLLRFGVPDFKLEKWYIDRRVALLEEEGVALRVRRRRRHGRDRGGAAAAPRRGRAGHRLARAPRARRARRRPAGRALRDGLPLRAQPLGRARRPQPDDDPSSPPPASTSS